MLNNPIYRKLTTDLTNRKEVQITSLINKSDIPEEVASRPIPHASGPPRLYKLQKIQKKEASLRTI